MRVSINIDCDSAAFDDNPGAELSRILSKCECILKYTNPVTSSKFMNLKDVNGNSVGTLYLENNSS